MDCAQQPPQLPSASSFSMTTEFLSTSSATESLSDSADPFPSLFPALISPFQQRTRSAALGFPFLPASSPCHSTSSAFSDAFTLSMPSLADNDSELEQSLHFSHTSFHSHVPPTPQFPSRENSNTSSDESSLSPVSDSTTPALTPPNSMLAANEEMLDLQAFAEEYCASTVDLFEDPTNGILRKSSKQEAQPTMALAITPNQSQAAICATIISANTSSTTSSSSSSSSSSSASNAMMSSATLPQSSKKKKRAAPDEEENLADSPKSEFSVEDEKESKKSCLPRGLLYHLDPHVHDRPPNKFLEFCPAHRAWTTLDYEGIFYIGLRTKVNGAHITALKSDTLKSGITWREHFNLLSSSVAAKGYTLFVLGVGSRLRPAFFAKLKGKIRFEQSLPSEARCRRCRLKAEVMEWTLMEMGEDRETDKFNQELENVLSGKSKNVANSRQKRQRNEPTPLNANALVEENDVKVSEELLAFYARLQLTNNTHPLTSSSSRNGETQQLMRFEEYYQRLLKLYVLFHVYAHSTGVELSAFASAVHLADSTNHWQLFLRIGHALQQLKLQAQSMYEDWQMMRSFDLLAEMIQHQLRVNAVSSEQLRLYDRQANFILRECGGQLVCSNWLGGCHMRLAVAGTQLCSECTVQYEQPQPTAQQHLPAIFLFARNVQTGDRAVWERLWSAERKNQHAVFAYNAENNVWMRRWSASECDSNELLMVLFDPMSLINSSVFDGCGPVYALVNVAMHAVNVMTSTTSRNGILAAVERGERRLMSAAEFQSLARSQQFYDLSYLSMPHSPGQTPHSQASQSSSFSMHSVHDEGAQQMAMVVADSGGNSGGDDTGEEQTRGLRHPPLQPTAMADATNPVENSTPSGSIEVSAPHGPMATASAAVQSSHQSQHRLQNSLVLEDSGQYHYSDRSTTNVRLSSAQPRLSSSSVEVQVVSQSSALAELSSANSQLHYSTVSDIQEANEISAAMEIHSLSVEQPLQSDSIQIPLALTSTSNANGFSPWPHSSAEAANSLQFYSVATGESPQQQTPFRQSISNPEPVVVSVLEHPIGFSPWSQSSSVNLSEQTHAEAAFYSSRAQPPPTTESMHETHRLPSASDRSSQSSSSSSGVGAGDVLMQLALLTSWFSSKAEQTLALLVVLFSASLAQQQAAAPQTETPTFPPVPHTHPALLDTHPSSSHSQSSDSFQHSVRFRSTLWQPPNSEDQLQSQLSSLLDEQQTHSNFSNNAEVEPSGSSRTNAAIRRLARAVSWFATQAKQSAATFVLLLSISIKPTSEQQNRCSPQAQFGTNNTESQSISQEAYQRPYRLKQEPITSSCTQSEHQGRKQVVHRQSSLRAAECEPEINARWRVSNSENDSSQLQPELDGQSSSEQTAKLPFKLKQAPNSSTPFPSTRKSTSNSPLLLLMSGKVGVMRLKELKQFIKTFAQRQENGGQIAHSADAVYTESGQNSTFNCPADRTFLSHSSVCAAVA